MAFCLISLGANLGERRASLDAALIQLKQLPAVRVAAVSRWYETPAVGGPPGQSPYLNGAALLETSLSPLALLASLQSIENGLGRLRPQHWAARTIDLDMLLFGREAIDSPELRLPHPRMAWRRFVLRPAAEIAAEMMHPTLGWSVGQMAEHLERAAPYVAITGSIGAGKSGLAERLSQQIGARLIAEPLDFEQLAAFYADPAGCAWQTELQFVEARAALLQAGVLPPVAGSWTFSDFWFDQSAAFARVWLTAEQWPAFRDRWLKLRSGVPAPKLIVLLEAPAAQLQQRIAGRGRRGEGTLSAERLQRIAEEIFVEATAPDRGPLLRQPNHDADATFNEVLAAVQAMECSITLA